jgi:ubiquinone/menaquinone biosynthesis C-methylase UbiE
MRRFAAELGITAETRVLDVGGTPDCWRLLSVIPRVTLLNTPRAKDDLGGAERWVAGDGRALPFRDGAFDVVFSNSVIEHVGDTASQSRFAAEAARVGRAYWVQTPNRWFPIEQHLLTPFLHWLPQRRQRRLVHFNFWRLLVRATPGQRRYYVEHYLGEIRLLSAAQLRELFPDAKITRERFLGWTKSLIAVRKPAVKRRGS